MGNLNYNRVGNFKTSRGFKVHPRRFTVSRLRAKFLWFFKFMSKWRCPCLRRTKTEVSSSARRGLVREKLQNRQGRVDCGRLRSFGRSNSFYTEAISDCLEFIKRSSISVDHRNNQ